MQQDTINVFPVGVNPPRPKKEIVRVTGGDTIVLRDFVTFMSGEPVTPENSILSFCLRDQKFSDDPIWVGGWYDGIELEDKLQRGHVVVKIPDAVSMSLRRGAFVYSLLVADKLLNNRRTCMIGSLLVEYEATSPHLSIPYKDGAEASQSYQHVSHDPKYVTGVNVGNEIYSPDKAGVVYLPEMGGTSSKPCVLPCDGKKYKMYLKLVDGIIVSYWIETYDDPQPVAATLDGETYYLRLKNVGGILTSYWEKTEDQ